MDFVSHHVLDLKSHDIDSTKDINYYYFSFKLSTRLLIKRQCTIMSSQIRVIILLYLTQTTGFKIQGTFFEKHGVLIEPSSYATHPLTFTYFTYNIIFDHPHMSVKRVDRCNNTNSYSDKLERYSQNYYQEVKDLLTSSSPLSNLPICKHSPTFCFNEDDNSIHSSKELIKRQKRFLPFIALAAGISALGLSFYNTFSQNQVTSAVDNLNKNQHRILTQLNAQNGQVNMLIDTERTIYTKLESFEKALDHLIDTDICNIKSEISYVYFLGKLQELHAKYERVINMIFLGKLSSDIIDPLSFKQIILSNTQLKNSVLADDITLAYRLTQLMPLGIINDHMGISVLLRIPVIEIQDISPIFSITNVGWYINNHYERFKVPDEFYLLLEHEKMYALEINSESCQQVSNLWICDHVSHKTNEKTSCINALINHQTDIKTSCEVEVAKYSQSEIQEVRSGLLVSGHHDVSILKNIRSKLTVNSIIAYTKENFTFFPYGGDLSYSIDGIIYNSVQDPITVYINPTVFDYFSGLETIPEELGNNEWKDLSVLARQTTKLQESKHADLILQYPMLLTTASGLIYALFIIGGFGLFIWFIRRRYKTRISPKNVEIGNMRTLMSR